VYSSVTKKWAKSAYKVDEKDGGVGIGRLDY